jgi:hypothetical protein
MKLLILSLIVFSAPAVAQEGPQITFSESLHDFGDIERGARLSHTFEFENAGSAPLKIENVKTSCGCTAVRPSRGEFIGPKEAGTLPVDCTFDVLGAISCLLTVETNGGDTAKLTVKSQVKPKGK